MERKQALKHLALGIIPGVPSINTGIVAAQRPRLARVERLAKQFDVPVGKGGKDPTQYTFTDRLWGLGVGSLALVAEGVIVRSYIDAIPLLDTDIALPLYLSLGMLTLLRPALNYFIRVGVEAQTQKYGALKAKLNSFYK